LGIGVSPSEHCRNPRHSVLRSRNFLTKVCKNENVRQGVDKRKTITGETTLTLLEEAADA
jgi:hypothetical protein